MIIRYTLSDLNMRRLFENLILKQKESNDWIDLSMLIFLPHPQGRESPLVSSIGLSSEVIVPWDMSKDQTLLLQARINDHETLIPDDHQYA